MVEENLECLDLDGASIIPLGELAACCGMTVEELDELVDYNALLPSPGDLTQRVFSVQWVSPLRTAAKLRLDFDLDIFTVAMVLGHLDRIAKLERQVQTLQALLPAHLSQAQYQPAASALHR